MSNPTRADHPIYSLLPTDIEGFDSLAELALNMRSSWNHATDGVWRQLDPELWALTQNPWVVLQTVSRERIEKVLADPVFRKNVDDLIQTRREVIPEFYTRDDNDIPVAWVARMRESMARLAPRFSADRAVREYTERYYLPAAAAYHSRIDSPIANNGETPGPPADWRHGLDQKWTAVRFGEAKIETHDGQHLFEVPLCFGELDPKTVRVELYADGVMGGAPICQEMKSLRQSASASGGSIYSAAVSAARPAGDYTARVIPRRNGVAVPLEDARILWQR